MGMSFAQLLAVLRARRRIIVLACVACTLSATLVSALLPKRYVASSDVLVDVKGGDPLMGEPTYSPLVPNYLATQADIVTSKRVVDRVIHQLGLDSAPEAVAAWKKAAHPNESIEQFYAHELNSHLQVKPSHESNVLTIAFGSNSPHFAADAANAYARAFIDLNAELRTAPAKDFAAFFDARARDARAQLEQAQARLSQFQQEHGIVATDDRASEAERLSALNGQLTVVQGMRNESVSRQSVVGGRIDVSPDVVQSAAVAALSTDLARADAKVEELGRRYGQNHPTYQEALAERDTLKVRLRSEMRRIADSVGAAADVAVRREAATREALESEKRRVLQLRALRDQMAVLQRDVESAQHNFDAVAQRLSRSSLESQAHLANVAILSEAVAPVSSSNPGVVLNAAVALLMGALLGAGLALAQEARERRLRSAEDVAQFMAVPVLASYPPRVRPLLSAPS